MSASKEQAAALAPFELNDDLVRDYLKAHDDFLQRNPDLLDYLHVEHQSGSAVSLVEKQVSVLRERNMDMRHRIEDRCQHKCGENEEQKFTEFHQEPRHSYDRNHHDGHGGDPPEAGQMSRTAMSLRPHQVR